MESIPKFQWDDFINALYPHFETIFYDQLAKKISYKDYSVNVFKSKYIKEEFDYDDNLIRLVYPSIVISFKWGNEAERPILKRW